MLLVHVAVLLALVGTDAFFGALAILNRRYEERVLPGEREWVEEVLGVDDPDELLDYQRQKTGHSLVQSWSVLLLVLVVLYSGLFADAVVAVRDFGLSPVAEGVVFVLGVLLAYRVVGIPFDLYDTFVVEEIYGFNEQSPRLWVRDFLVGTVLTVAIAGPLVAAVLWFLESFALWWVAAWGLSVVFIVALQILVPRVIYPLYYDFTPLEGGELRDAVDEVFERAGFACDQVFEMDASRRSSHTNAFFMGFGRTKRVVLYDTLVEGMDVDEVQSVLAHELAHWKKGHIWKFVALGAVEYLVVFAALGFLVDYAPLYEAFGVPTDAAFAGFLLAGLLVTQVYRLTSPISNALSLRFERQADSFAVETMNAESMFGALSELAAENLSELFPHPWYETFHYDHPPIPERLRYVRSMGESEDAPTGGAEAAD